MGGEVATALVEARPPLVERLVLIDLPATADAKFTVAMHAYLTPVLGEAMSRILTDSGVRRGLAQGFAPEYPIPERFVADFRQLTYRAFRLAHEESVAYRTNGTHLRTTCRDQAGLPPLLAVIGSMDAIVISGVRNAVRSLDWRTNRNRRGLGSFAHGGEAGENARAHQRLS